MHKNGSMPKEKRTSLEICILAGGLSLRIGRDKTKLRLGRRTLLGHVRQMARELGRHVRVIRRDVVPRCGPLGGVYTALATTRADAVLFLSCDMPFVPARLLRRISVSMRKGQTAVFTTQRERVGFPFAIRAEALSAVRELLAERQFSLQNLARILQPELIHWPATRSLELFNINLPADWQQARELWKARTSSGRKREHGGRTAQRTSSRVQC